MPDPWFTALGDGWLGKLIAGVLCATLAWFARRPAETAAIMLATDQRIKTAFGILDGQLKDALAGIAAANAKHAECELKLKSMREEIDALMAGPVAEYNTITRPKP